MVRLFPEHDLKRDNCPDISYSRSMCRRCSLFTGIDEFVFVVDKISKMFITGPEVIKTVLGEEISMEDLGGARVHSEITGSCTFFNE